MKTFLLIGNNDFVTSDPADDYRDLPLASEDDLQEDNVDQKSKQSIIGLWSIFLCCLLFSLFCSFKAPQKTKNPSINRLKGRIAVSESISFNQTFFDW